MGKILLLPDDVSSKIAAGEVIERPASVVRELIDNSVDAYSTEITIKIEGYGAKRVVVSDNGCGMDRDDLALSFKKHSTSKIREINDLYNLSTMGFRGEALYSIETISNLSIISNNQDNGDSLGYRIANYGERRYEVTEIASKRGTKVEVTNLFFNLPARLRFLKSAITEINQIKKTISDKALSFLDVSFKFYNDNKLIFETTNTNNFKKNFFDIYTNENNFEIFHYEEFVGNDIKIDIYYSSLDTFFPTRKYQTLYVNRRAVTVPFFYNALDNGLRNYISTGRHPLVYFFIDINPNLIDINIHPAKKEIKFYNQNEIYLLIQNGISKAISQIVKREILDNNFVKKEIIESNYGLFEGNTTTLQDKQYKKEYNNNYSYEINEIDPNYKSTTKSRVRIHGVCFDNYLIVEYEEKILLIDQHAASESILFSLKKEIFSKNIDIENLLIPVEITIEKWHENIDTKIANLNNIGFLITKKDDNRLTISAIPSILLIKKDYQIAIDIILKYFEDEFDENHSVIDYILIEASCKEAIKKGDNLNLIEINELANEYIKQGITNCPHGRPSHFEISKSHLEKLFQRKK